MLTMDELDHAWALMRDLDRRDRALRLGATPLKPRRPVSRRKQRPAAIRTPRLRPVVQVVCKCTTVQANRKCRCVLGRKVNAIYMARYRQVKG